MKIKKGYKQTEIGIIPEDWEEKKLGEIGDVCMCKRIFKEQTLATGEIPFYKIGTFGNKPDAFISIELYNDFIQRFSFPKKDDILFSAAGTIGRTVIYDGKPAYFQDSNIVWIDNNEDIVKNSYLYYFYKTVKWTTSDGGIVSRLYNKHIRNTLLPVPTLAEQTAIATVLSDMDEYILSLDRLIVKKKAIKQGTMQNLLTGKIRLKGFKGRWVEKKLGEIVDVIGGGTPSTSNPLFWNGFINWFTPTEIGKSKFVSESERKITNEGLRNSSAKMLPIGTILLTSRATIGDVSILKNEGCTNQGFQSLIAKEDINNDFLYYKLLTIKNIILSLASGSTFLEISPNKLRQIEISIPTFAEQTTIAAILSDMDAEIEALQTKLQKAKLVKQGAMQELLTGQIRLINTLSQSQGIDEIRTISVAAHVVGGHIVNKLYGSKGWGRTKLQKSMHLIGYCCQLDFGSEYIRNVAGPDDQLLMNHIDSKFRQYRHVCIEVKNDGRGGKHYNYIPTNLIAEVEQAFERYPSEVQKTVNDLLNKIKKMDLARAEIVSTLYAVWNNRIIKRQAINDDLLLKDFYDWSVHKSDFSPDLVLRGLNYMRKENIIPIGWGKYIDKKYIDK
jgi:type I restriction enzyme S subunit